MNPKSEAKIRGQFSKLDVDKSGFITKEEMLPIVADPFYYAGDQSSVRVFTCEVLKFQL